MKHLSLILIILLFSCNQTQPKHQCIEYEIAMQNLDREIEKAFKKNDRLINELENAHEYILLLEEENAKLIENNGK